MNSLNVTIRMLGADDGQVLESVADDVFDNAVERYLTMEFLADPRHHIVVAMDERGVVVGMASAVHYLHPDKPNQLFINEVGVSGPFQRKGIGARLMAALLTVGESLGCTEAWVLTDTDNVAARSLYEGLVAGTQEQTSVMYSFPLSAGSGVAVGGESVPIAKLYTPD